MSDILIKNIGSLPKEMECVEILLFSNGYCSFRKHERDEWVEAKAIELPPHGTLKEIPFILDCLEAMRKDYPEEYNLIRLAIDRTPFVLEASK